MRVAVIGLGYVGLPLASQIAELGHNVIGYDVDESRIWALASGRSYVDDISETQLLKLVRSGNFYPTSDSDHLVDCDTYLICVPTPLTKNGDPDVGYIRSAGEVIARYIRRGDLVVLESTTFAGTTSEVLRPILEMSGLRAGEDFNLAFSPERVDPRNARFNLQNTPKLVSGLTDACLDVASRFYSQFVDHVIPVSSLMEAEMAKLVENTFRFINIAFVNELAKVCDKMGVDVWNVIDAASTKPYGFSAFYPGPGVGGHCIPVDPIYLSERYKELTGESFKLIELSKEVNDSMPRFITEKILSQIVQFDQTISTQRIVLLGLSYKANISDMRASPAFEIARILLSQGKNVAYFEPNCSEIQSDLEKFEGLSSLDEIRTDDALILLQGHDEIINNLQLLRGNIMLDCRAVSKADAVGSEFWRYL